MYKALRKKNPSGKIDVEWGFHDGQIKADSRRKKTLESRKAVKTDFLDWTKYYSAGAASRNENFALIIAMQIGIAVFSAHQNNGKQRSCQS